MERRGPIGYYVHKVLPLDDIFKVFYDNETGKVRLVLVMGHITETMDFEVMDRSGIIGKLSEEMGKIGRQM